MNFGSTILRRLLVAFATLVFLVLQSAAQNTLDPGSMRPGLPTITFELDWKLADPQFYRITVDENGQATYESQPRATGNQPGGEPYRLRFIMSQPMRTKIFDLAKALNDFRGNFETRNKVAQTGKKTLTYEQGATENKTTLNFSDNQQMNELITLFQKMSTTFEVAQKLDYEMRFDKLGLDRDLKNLVRLDKDNQLAELQVLSPTLERIANDEGVMNIARQKARQLLERSRPVVGQR
ncbi:MAG: hypothetical protein ACM3JB_24480 [Acidobacteriaceae bacterium]